jgi:hypothetical protein
LHVEKNWVDPGHDPRDNWLMDSEKGPVVITTVATTGLYEGERHELAGSMSKLYGQPLDTRTKHVLGSLSMEEFNMQQNKLAELKKSNKEKYEEIIAARAEAGDEQVLHAIESMPGVEAKDVIIMKPQSDYHTDRKKHGIIVCADDVERTDSFIRDTRPAFMMYSHDTERVIGLLPADCPVLVFSGVDRDGKPIHGLIHSGWNDEDRGVPKQGIHFLKRIKNVDIKDLNFYVAPGGVEFGYSRPTNPLDDPKDLKFSDKNGWANRLYDMTYQGEKGYRFTIDMIGFLIDDLKREGATDHQIFIDSTDTVDPTTGHASHKLASRGTIPPMRDGVFAVSPNKKNS